MYAPRLPIPGGPGTTGLDAALQEQLVMRPVAELLRYGLIDTGVAKIEQQNLLAYLLDRSPCT